MFTSQCDAVELDKMEAPRQFLGPSGTSSVQIERPDSGLEARMKPRSTLICQRMMHMRAFARGG